MNSVIEGNKLIAEFDGHIINYGFDKTGVLFLGQHIGEEKLIYHSSWDWLMPVARKCFLQAEEMEADEWTGSIQDVLSNMHIESLHRELVDFIKWYNKEK